MTMRPGLVALAFWSLAGALPALADCAPGRVELRSPPGAQAQFSVDLAVTADQREHGLMDRPSMPAGSGMLFVYDSPRHVRFWMKDTLIPLDMLFFDAMGRLQRVKDSAQPLDLTPVDGGEGIAYVLEINGGLAARMGLEPGTLMRSPDMAPPLAWPCD